MTTRATGGLVPTIYGEGAPAIQPTEGLRYIDTVANAEYAAYGGAWVAMGGGGGGLPYVLGPYAVYVYGNSLMPGSYNGFYIYSGTYSGGAYGKFSVKADQIEIEGLITTIHSSTGNISIGTSGMASALTLYSNGGLYLNSSKIYAASLPTVAGASNTLYVDPITYVVKRKP